MKKTVVLGASPNPSRYSYLAVERLTQNQIEAIPVGIRKGKIGELDIKTDRPELEDVHTVTMYVGAARQPDWYDYIFSLHPKRIIFNPGAENDELAIAARQKGIEVEQACTLVMLSVGNY